MTTLFTPEGEVLAEKMKTSSFVPWQEYPRPQLVRDSFFNLNGEWEFAVSDKDELPEAFGEKIVVPFPPESALSGVGRVLPKGARLFYKKRFPLPEEMQNGRVLLHFGAADQIARVWLNGEFLGGHEGGYEAFSFDVTADMQETNELIVCVTDPMETHVFPYGKQTRKRGGMWYTPVSGLWQTVWMERVPETYIRDLTVTTTLTSAEIAFDGVMTGTVKVQTPGGEILFPVENGKAVVTLDEPRPWSPEDPYLYRFAAEAEGDRVESYFALRTLTIEKFGSVPRLCLNGKPYFFHGVLDQGYFPDGLFTPANPACYEKDILAMKKLGFNTLRKHIKVEAEAFYYACDRLGMVVFQDMVNNGKYSFLFDTALPTVGFKRKCDRFSHRDPAARRAFLDSMVSTVKRLKNHPSVCYWTIFNEGWGQFESTNAYRLLKKLDSTRFVATVSGWFKGGESDVETEHVYFKRFRPKRNEKPLLLTEFGGYSFSVPGHVFNPDKEYGYRHYKTQEEYVLGVQRLYEAEVIPAVEKGLCAAIYTQLSDVEDETNGLVTYDRKTEKFLPNDLLSIAKKLAGEMAKGTR